MLVCVLFVQLSVLLLKAKLSTILQRNISHQLFSNSLLRLRSPVTVSVSVKHRNYQMYPLTCHFVVSLFFQLDLKYKV